MPLWEYAPHKPLVGQPNTPPPPKNYLAEHISILIIFISKGSAGRATAMWFSSQHTTWSRCQCWSMIRELKKYYNQPMSVILSHPIQLVTPYHTHAFIHNTNCALWATLISPRVTLGWRSMILLYTKRASYLMTYSYNPQGCDTGPKWWAFI